MRIILLIVLLLIPPFMTAHAGEADVVAVEVHKAGKHTYQFDVTVAHNDEGWNHYASKWDVMGPDGIVFGT